MKLIELLPKENTDWFLGIFEIAEAKSIENKKNEKKEKYVYSKFYETSMLLTCHYYKPVII